MRSQEAWNTPTCERRELSSSAEPAAQNFTGNLGHFETSQTMLTSNSVPDGTDQSSTASEVALLLLFAVSDMAIGEARRTRQRVAHACARQNRDSMCTAMQLSTGRTTRPWKRPYSIETRLNCETRRIASDEARNSGEMPRSVVTAELSTSGPMPPSAPTMRAAWSAEATCRAFSMMCREKSTPTPMASVRTMQETVLYVEPSWCTAPSSCTWMKSRLTMHRPAERGEKARRSTPSITKLV
mmetsp:Transcript_42940/g.100635  ORF Transcript_42940/g.100635 Transcript_42940/m.100635 type:complete len:241 (+) Transcript_42940:221-943(+)